MNIPGCPHCHTNKDVRREHAATAVGTVGGAVAGVLATCGGEAQGVVVGSALCSVIPVLGSLWWTTAGSLTAALLGAVVLGTVGYRVGYSIDKAVAIYHCSKCGKDFQLSAEQSKLQK